jgi:hypothetical protein
MRGDAWRVPGCEDVAGSWFDGVGMRGVKADHRAGNDRQVNAALFCPGKDGNILMTDMAL